MLRISFLLFTAAVMVFAQSAVAQDQAAAADGELANYIVKFEGKSLAAASGPIRRQDHTHRRNAAGRLVLDVNARGSVAFLEGLRGTQNSRLELIEGQLDRDLEVLKRFDVVLNGVAVQMTEAEANRVAELPFVEFVQREPIYQLDTYAGPPWIGADSIWDGSATVSGIGNRGEGMIAGVIDSGINTQGHPSFAATADDGYTFTNPLGSGVYLGDCIDGTTGSDLVQCNDKLIGAYAFTGGDPEDTLSDVGHGSHTASTMAGNLVQGPFTLNDGAVVPAPEISGVAPRANVIAYRACNGGCPGFATSGSLQQALIDGVNATNYSIGPTFGGRGSNPWSDASNRIMLDLVAAGIFTAASAGNTRGNDNPNPEADVANKGPWIATVANSTHGGVVAHDAGFADSGGPAVGLESVIAVPGSGPAVSTALSADVIYAGEIDAANFEGCNAWTGSPFTNSILLVSRGSCNFSVKVDNAAAAGAIAVVVHNNVPGAPFRMGALETTSIPSVMIPRDDGIAASSFITGASSPSVTIPVEVNTELVEEWGNVLSAGSLKGPNLDFDVTEPDLNAPGTQILAANAAGGAGDFRFLNGTSMSGPHIAGAGLLLLAEHPEWTPTEVLSAMMLTADPIGTLSDATTATTPDDVGSGTADLTKASLAGLVMNESFDNFLAANPATGGDPRTLNLPSMRHTSCDPTCSWTRVVRNAKDVETSWTATANSAAEFDVSVVPASFELLPADVIFRDQMEDGTGPNSSYQTLEITVSNNSSGAAMRFGELILAETGLKIPSARMTIAVSQSLPAAPPL